MFEQVTPAPPDSILGLTEAFKKDPNPDKINLGVGVYKDTDGTTPILHCVKRAEHRCLTDETTKSYLGMAGSDEYAEAVLSLLFGAGSEVVASRRARVAQSPGGTGALRVAGDFISKLFSSKRIWLSDPTWGNHAQVFQAAGLETASYPYYDAESKCLDFQPMLDALKQVPEGEVVLLHACCHNPTGMDPTPEQWTAIADVMEERKWIPLVDFAYQGFGDGLDEDAGGLRTLASRGGEMLASSSFSKNFGLYRERVGALTVVGASEDGAERAFSHVKKCIRANYSNPPAHGGMVVTTILNDAELRADWEGEVKAMRDRINGMRHLFVETLKAKGVNRDFSFITRQRGMFSFSGLDAGQVQALREKYAIYVVGSGRINVAGMTEGNMDRLCTAIADVLGEA